MIDSTLFEHPQLKIALQELTEFSFFEKEIMTFYEDYEKKKQIPDLLGKTVKVTQNQIPSLYKLAKAVCERIECDSPNIYVYEDFYYGLESKGVRPSWIEISAKTVTDLTDKELLFLLGREIGAIQMNYVYYHILLDEAVKAVHYQLVDSSLLKDSWKVMMYRWSRLAHYSADCFGYAVCGDIGASIKAISKLVLNNCYLAENIFLPDYIAQSEEIELLDEDIYLITKKDERVPYAPYRIKNLLRYASSNRGMEAVKFFQKKGSLI